MNITVKGLLIVGLPVLLLILGAYIFTRAQNRALQASSNAIAHQNDVMQGELYKLRQDIAGRDARIAMLVQPDFRRYKAVSQVDSSSCWLFWRERDSAWYAEVSHAMKLDDGWHYRFYSIRDAKSEYIGSFEPITETVGLQKIGSGAIHNGGIVTMAERNSDVDFSNEEPVLQVKQPD